MPLIKRYDELLDMSGSKPSTSVSENGDKTEKRDFWDRIELSDTDHGKSIVRSSLGPDTDTTAPTREKEQSIPEKQQEEPGFFHLKENRRKPSVEINLGEQDSDETQPVDFSSIHNTSQPQDFTVHIDFEVSIDLDDDLEGFSALVRRGNFRKAVSFFSEHLMAYISDPWVFVQYADMLLRMGDFKSINQLNPGPVFQPRFSSSDSDKLEALNTLQMNWKLIKAVALAFSRRELEPILEELRGVKVPIPFSKNIGSTEISIICLTMQLVTHAERACDKVIFSIEMPKWGNWEDLYQALLVRGCVWDFRDVVLAALDLFGPEDVRKFLLGSINTPDVLLTDWMMGDQDISTLLALLDITAHLALNSARFENTSLFADECLLSANRLGETIMEIFPEDTTSGPFITWVFVQAQVFTRRGKSYWSLFEYLGDYPGGRGSQGFLSIPFYVPVRDENPGWIRSEFPRQAIEPLELALKESRKLKDYKLEAICLAQLIIHTQEPKSLFDELEYLQKEKQHDIQGYLGTCLSRYLVSNNSDDKAKLLKKLNEFGWMDDVSDIIWPDRAFAREVIQCSLSSVGSKKLQTSLKVGVRYYHELPDRLQRLISKYVETAPRSPRKAKSPGNIFERGPSPVRVGEGSYSRRRSTSDERMNRKNGRGIRDDKKVSRNRVVFRARNNSELGRHREEPQNKDEQSATDNARQEQRQTRTPSPERQRPADDIAVPADTQAVGGDEPVASPPASPVPSKTSTDTDGGGPETDEVRNSA